MGRIKNDIILNEENCNDEGFDKSEEKNEFYSERVNFSDDTFFNFMYNVVAGKYSGQNK